MSNASDFVIEKGVLKKYVGPGGDVVIPETVRSIATFAFYRCAALTTVTIPEGVYAIGAHVFSECTSLTTINLPRSMNTIKDYAFYGCSKLKRITIFEETLKICAPWLKIFGGTGKTVELVVYRLDEEPLYTVGAFRKEYWNQRFECQNDYIVPLSAEDVPNYDKLVATGEFDGFKMNEQGRLKAMLLRLKDQEHPVSAEYQEMFADFLADKFNKVIKCAEEDRDPAYILAAAKAGAVNEDNLRKITNALKKSKTGEIQETAEQVAALLSNRNPEPEKKESTGVDKKYTDRLKKINAKAVLMKMELTSIPEVLMADGVNAAPTEYVALIIAEYLSQHKNLSYSFAPLADEIALLLDRTALQKTVTNLYLNATNDKKQQAYLPLLFRYADGTTVSKQYRNYKSLKWMADKIDSCLMLSDTREAMILADRYNLLERYAQMRGKTADELQDTILYDFGFNEQGKKTYDLGTKTIIVTMNADLMLILQDAATSKIVKSIPKKDAEPERYTAACEDFAETKKNLRRAAKSKSDRLFQEFLDSKEYSAEKWKAIYLTNPLLRQIANLLIWEQAGQTFILSGDNAITVDGHAYALTAESIRLAHPMDLNKEAVRAWQEYLTSRCLKQPFEQIWEPVVDAKTIAKDRYKDCMIPFYRFKGREKHGIYIQDWDFHSQIDISFDGCYATVDRIDWARHEIDMSHRFAVQSISFDTLTRKVNHILAYLDRITVYDRIVKDDATIAQFLHSFTLAQITEFIKLASENNCPNVTAILLEFQQKNFPNFDPLAEFTLE